MSLINVLLFFAPHKKSAIILDTFY